MLKKQNRLSSTFHFHVVKKYGTRYQFDHFNLVVVKPLNYLGLPKIGIVVSNKIDKRATERNKLKRLFREAFRHALDNIPANQWLVVYPKESSKECTYENINAEVTQALQKVVFTH